MKIFFLISFSLIPFSSIVFADQNIVSLKDAIAKALKNNLEIKTEGYKSSIAATDLTLIKGELLPKINATAGVGPINGKKGNYAFYQDQNTWGAAWVGSIEAKIPLFVWGRGDDLKRAAQLNTELNKLDVIKKQNEIISKLKVAYYGWQYAMSLLDFVSETQKDLDQAVEALKDKKGKKEE